MALLFMDGFDKYGGTNSSTAILTGLLSGEWTSSSGTITLVAPLSSTGQAVNFGSLGTLVKTLPGNYGRIIGGLRFSTTNGNNCGIQFLDGASNQCGIRIASTGIISMMNGNFSSGTVVASGASAVTANTTHYLEWDITLGNSAAYNVYLDGVSIISGTGDTTATANNTISGVSFGGAASASLTIDDLYLFDTSGSTNNAVLLTSPRIETTLPASDSAVQFSIGASVIGATTARSTATNSNAANLFYLRPITPARSCTLNSITIAINATSATINLRPIVYADSSSLPGALLSAGSTVTGMTAATPTTLMLTTPLSLTAGTQYWLGFMADISATGAWLTADAANSGRTSTVTFASGAPGTAGTTSAAATYLLWGNVTLASPVNYYEVSQQPPPAANQSYVFDGTVGDEDLYNFPNLSQLPATVYAVAVKAYCARSDAGARTVSLRMKSGSTDGGGSSTGQTPGTSYAWISSLFETDPNTGAAWTGANLNAATTGFKIDA